MDHTITVVSSNIRYDEPNDDPHSWDNRKDFLAERLLRFRSDLLATQEGRKWQLDEIAERLPGLTRIDTHRQWIETLMYPCLFYNPSQLTLQDSGDIWLSESPTLAGSRSFGSEFPRLGTWAAFEEGFLAINVHLDHEQSDTRVRQIYVLLQRLRRIEHPTSHILLMGDFNEGPEGAVRAVIKKEMPELVDPWIELGLAEDSSHHCFGEPIDYGSRVDWILTGRWFSARDILLDKARSEAGIYPSDHYILKARLAFRDR